MGHHKVSDQTAKHGNSRKIPNTNSIQVTTTTITMGYVSK